SICDTIRFSMQRKPVCIIGTEESCNIGDILAQSLMPIHRKVRKRSILIELRREGFSRGLEVIEVGLGPPVGKPALSIELTPLIIKAVADLVTDDSSHGSVIVGGVGCRIEVRWLENRGWKIQRILQRQINGVYRLRSHPPLSAVDRLVKFRELPVILEQLSPLGVANGIAFD